MVHRLLLPVITIAATLFATTLSPAQQLDPTFQVTCKDRPYDAGQAILVSWNLPAGAGYDSLILYRAVLPEGELAQIASMPPGDTEYVDETVSPGQEYIYKVVGSSDSVLTESSLSAPVEAKRNWFDSSRLPAFVIVIVFAILVLGFIFSARRGIELFIRRVAGLNAVDEAIGRATELGKKIMYIPGILSIDEPQTIASLSVLRHVASSSAQYNAELEVPNKDPLTFAAARETVKEAYLEQGRPDIYKEDIVNYVTYDQFAYTAAVSGKMVREKPATIFLVGSFFAESLLLAETGHSTGAIQIAGTAEIHQLPFLVCACDYTLIGEELYAASAYLTREPVMMGSIKGQDVFKLILLILILIGIILETAGITWFTEQLTMI
jgi:hypothetical protein